MSRYIGFAYLTDYLDVLDYGLTITKNYKTTTKQLNTMNNVGAKVYDDKVKIQVAVPGFTKEALAVEFKDDVLYLTGETTTDNLLNIDKLEHEFHVDTKKYDVTKTELTHDLGILTITIPVKPESLPLTFKLT